MLETDPQKIALDKLVAELESRGSDPTVLYLEKSFDELTAEQQAFLIELCRKKAEAPDATPKN